jgi:thiol-disulfide isomerase/thioredoxin
VPRDVLDEVDVAGTTISADPSSDPLAVMKPAGAPGDGLPEARGRPVVFYFGALWCPFCATERWPVVVALSRFGTFSHLGSAVSSPTDVYPSTQSWSFHGAGYSSRYVAFAPVEFEGEDEQPLDPLDRQDLTVLHRWDPGGRFPFLTIGGRFTAGLPPWLSPQLLQGRTQRQIADALARPTSQLGAAIDADANYLTAAICAVDGQAPASVCGAGGVRAAAALLAKLPAAQPIAG